MARRYSTSRTQKRIARGTVRHRKGWEGGSCKAGSAVARPLRSCEKVFQGSALKQANLQDILTRDLKRTERRRAPGSSSSSSSPSLSSLTTVIRGGEAAMSSPDADREGIKSGERGREREDARDKLGCPWVMILRRKDSASSESSRSSGKERGWGWTCARWCKSAMASAAVLRGWGCATASSLSGLGLVDLEPFGEVSSVLESSIMW